MPILAGVRPAPPAPLPGVGFASATYIDPTGEAWPLTNLDIGWFTLSEGVSGLDVAPYELTKDAHPRGGSRLRHAQPVERTIIWPLYVYGSDHQDFIGRWRALGKAFARTLREGPGWLEIARPNGQRRRIQVIYQEGFEGRGEQGYGIVSDAAVISLYCPDPYWQDSEPVVEAREHGAGVDFFAPFPSVSSSQVLGGTVLYNPGDVEAWPVWTISGPASKVTMTHEDTGESFEITPIGGDLQEGDQVTVATDPPRVRGPNGEVWTAALNWPGAVLWSLRPGPNNVSFQLDGADTGSRVQVEFYPRYEMA